MTSPRPGRLIGVGTGPGDPELLTLKAVRALENADVVAHFAKRGNNSNARRIVADLLPPDVAELALLYPVTTEIEKTEAAYRRAIDGFYEQAAASVAERLDAGQTVAVLSEGDPLFYGSYMHLHVRLAERYRADIIPGVTAMSGAWSQTALPISQGDDVLTVLPGTMAESELARRLSDTDPAVIMKVGRNLPKIRRALEDAGRLGDAFYVERATMKNGHATRLADKGDDQAPYFSIVLIPGWRGRA
ncbi:MAG: precorrin-2 C(20)-methyltransferase [Nitratireductor sp.]